MIRKVPDEDPLMSVDRDGFVVADAESCDGAPYPQEGSDRMLMPQPIAVVGTGTANPEKGLLRRMDPDHVFMMGDNPRLPRMPKAPRLLDFFRLRFSDIAF